MQKYGKLMNTQFHKLDHESKMRLRKTHPHTSEQRGNEVEKKHQEKEKERRSTRTGQKKRHKENNFHITGRPGGGAKTSRRKYEYFIQHHDPGDGGGANLDRRTREHTRSHKSCATALNAKMSESSPAPNVGGGYGQDETMKQHENRLSCATMSGPVP